MDLVVRKSKYSEWGMVESFSDYYYDGHGAVTVTCCVTPDGELSKPYALRGEEFVGLEVIEHEMGIERYLKAKKPIYSKLDDGFIVKIKAGIDYSTDGFLPEKTVANAYTVVRREVVAPNTYKLIADPIVSVTPELKELLEKLAKKVIQCKGNRADYLRGRL